MTSPGDPRRFHGSFHRRIGSTWGGTSTVHKDDPVQSWVLTDPKYILIPDIWEVSGKGVEFWSGTEDLSELSDRAG